MLNQFKTVIILGLLAGLLMGVGWLIGGYQGLTIGLIFAIVMNFGTYWFSDRIVLWMYKAQEAKKSEYPELYKMVSDVAKLAGIPMPKVYIMQNPTPNAFATGRNPKHAVVACTTGIMELLNKEELKGVIAHEISHIRNRDILIQTIAATIAAVISYVAMMTRYAAIFGGVGGKDDRDGGGILGFLLLAIVTPLIAMLLQLALSRSREYLADESGAKIIKNPSALASALAKLETGVKNNPMRIGSPATSSLFIVNPFSAKGLTSLLSTHPPMDERIKRLKDMRV
ncbi:protease HtpX [Candidatus Woesearchaeota archaeon CG10_big_fil_rev_8_21_14_0_10_44_13]|nr:MAG: protease HtpX [Candidatus Woesearchaeota archaeon CG10_big_fil_rev_8_21_14_0_10_44_13]